MPMALEELDRAEYEWIGRESVEHAYNPRSAPLESGALTCDIASHRRRATPVPVIEANGINMRNSKRIREVYAGPRNLGSLNYTDYRDLEWQGNLMLRLRKTFGG